MSILTDAIEDKYEKVKVVGVEFEFRPITSKHVGIFQDGEKDSGKMMNKLLLATLQQTDASITQKEVEAIPFMELTDAMEALMRVNGIDTGDGKSTEDSSKLIK